MLGILTAMVLFVVPVGICSVCILCAIAGAVVIPATLNIIEFVSLIVPSLCIALPDYFLSIWNASDQASRTFLNKYRHLVTTAQEEAKLATHSATQANHSPASAAPEQASADQRETDLQSQPLSMTQECAKSLNSANEEHQQDVKVRKKEHEQMGRRIDMLESDNRVAASEIQGYIEAHQLQTKEAEDALEQMDTERLEERVELAPQSKDTANFSYSMAAQHVAVAQLSIEETLEKYWSSREKWLKGNLQRSNTELARKLRESELDKHILEREVAAITERTIHYKTISEMQAGTLSHDTSHIQQMHETAQLGQDTRGRQTIHSTDLQSANNSESRLNIVAEVLKLLRPVPEVSGTD